jgi:hypothetical protein
LIAQRPANKRDRDVELKREMTLMCGGAGHSTPRGCSAMFVGTVCRADDPITVMATLAFKCSICRLLIGILVFSQLAISAFACSNSLGVGALEPPSPAAVAVPMVDDSGVAPMASKGGGMDSMLSNLCVAHCQYGQQSADHTAAPSVPAALLTSLYALSPLGEVSGPAMSLAGPLRAPAAAHPPHAILHCCFRI